MIVWLVATLTNLVLWPILLRRPVSQEWLRSAAVDLQLYGGVVWGSLPLLAMPQDEQWQIFLGAFGMGVQASSVLFAAQIRRLFYAFHIPNFVLSVTRVPAPGRWGRVPRRRAPVGLFRDLRRRACPRSTT